MKTKERLMQIIAALNVSVTDFETRCGLIDGYVDSIKNRINAKGLTQILMTYPNINKDWLLLGRGEMFRDVQIIEPPLNTIKERLVAYIRSKGISQRKFEISAGLSNGVVNNMKDNISGASIKKITAAFPDLNSTWLLTGEGEMLIGNEARPFLPPRDIVHVPLVSQYAQAGYLSGYADEDYQHTLPTIPFMPDREMTGTYMAFEVKGDSMDDGTRDAYCEGDIVICRMVEQEFYKNNRLHYNKRDFVIVHEEGILLKRVIAHDVENHLITIHSLNNYYQDKIIDLAEVKQMFSIVHMIRKR